MSTTNVARAGKRGDICVGNNVSATMCPRLPGPLTEFHCQAETSLKWNYWHYCPVVSSGSLILLVRILNKFSVFFCFSILPNSG